MPANTTIDLIGCIVKKDAVILLKMRSGEERDKLNIIVADETGVSVPVTFWGENCTTIDKKIAIGDVIAIKNLRVSDYNGKCLNASTDIGDVHLKPQH